MSASRVSVVIPCFNQAHFLVDAIESVLNQTRRVDEILVIDDGSTDQTRETAKRFAGVRYLYQSNAGLSAARNAGIRNATGDYLVFLDADDVLDPAAVSVGSVCLDAHPEWAFVSGGHRRVGPDLQPIGEDCCWPVHADHYRALLRANYIGMHAAVVYRRDVLCRVGGFDERLRACEDYELYLRIARQYPVGCHGEVAACYRQHDQNISRKTDLMLAAALEVLRAQYPYVKDNPALMKAYLAGIRNWWEYFGDAMLREFRQGLPRTLIESAQILRLTRLLLHYPYLRKWLRNSRLHPSSVRRKARETIGELRRPTPVQPVQFGSFRSLQPLGSATFAASVARRYSDMFFRNHDSEMREDVLDIGPGECPLSYLASLPDESRSSIRCFLHMEMCEPTAIVGHLHRILQRPGVLLATLPGAAMHSDATHDRVQCRFTVRGAQQLFSSSFPHDLDVRSFGNAVTSLAALHRLPATSLTDREFRVDDPQYQLIVTVRAAKV